MELADDYLRGMTMTAFRLLLLSLLLAATSVSAQDREPTYAIGVDGLACPFCAYGIEKQLHKLDGVDSVETDIRLGLIIVQMRHGGTLERAQVEEAIEKAGFSLRSFETADKKAEP